MKHTLRILFLALFSTLIFVSCQDEVLVRTEDTTNADALLAEIATAENQLITSNTENNTVTIANEELENTLDSLWNVHDSMNYGYSSDPGEVHLTINVISAGNAIFSNPGGRTSGLVGATVNVTQNGKDITASSEGNGLYLFKGLVPGQASVRVEAADHTSVVANVYLWTESDEDAPDAEAYNASTQIILFPVSGNLAAKLVGNIYANTTTADDTLDRFYGTSVEYPDHLQGTYCAAPGPFKYSNYTQDDYDTWGNYASIYSSNPGAESVQFSDLTAGVKIYARPYFDGVWSINGSNLNGYITSITYTGLTTSTTVNADGTYELPLAAHSSYDDYDLFDYFELYSDTYIADHERLTEDDGSYDGEFDETGSTVKNFKFYNNTNGILPVYTGTGVTTTDVNPNSSLAVTRRVITEEWEYIPTLLRDDGYGGYENYSYLDELPSSGQSITRNVYFFPRIKQD